MQKVFEIIVDIQRKINTPVFEVNTNDLKSVKLLITIVKGHTPIDLTDKTVRISIRKPDDNIIFQDCEIIEAANGKVAIVLENQAYLMPGTHTAEVMCYKGEEVVAVTGTFSYRSIKGIMNNLAVESKSEFTTITNMLKSVQDTIKDVRENGTGIDAQARADIQKNTAALAEKAKQSDLNQTNSSVSATNKRVDELVIGSGNANAEVTDAHVSVKKNKTFPTVSNRFEEIEADTYAPMTNILTNSDFSNAANWTPTNGTASTSNNEFIFTVTTPNSSSRITHQLALPIVGHKYYVKGDIYAKYSNVTYLRFGNASTDTTYKAKAGEWNTIKGILTATTNGQLIFYHQTLANYVAGDTFKFRRMLVIDLTETFGAGKEPGVEEMEEYLARYDGWFKSTINMFNVSKILEDIKSLKSNSNIPGNSKTTPLFDGNGKLTQVNETENGSLKKETTLSYNSDGILTTVTEKNSDFTATYTLQYENGEFKSVSQQITDGGL